MKNKLLLIIVLLIVALSIPQLSHADGIGGGIIIAGFLIIAVIIAFLILVILFIIRWIKNG